MLSFITCLSLQGGQWLSLKWKIGCCSCCSVQHFNTTKAWADSCYLHLYRKFNGVGLSGLLYYWHHFVTNCTWNQINFLTGHSPYLCSACTHLSWCDPTVTLYLTMLWWYAAIFSIRWMLNLVLHVRQEGPLILSQTMSEREKSSFNALCQWISTADLMLDQARLKYKWNVFLLQNCIE